MKNCKFKRTPVENPRNLKMGKTKKLTELGDVIFKWMVYCLLINYL